MSIWDKIMLLFNKIKSKNEIKTLVEPKPIKELENTLEALKITEPIVSAKEKKEIETLICTGDGLGIQREVRS